MSSEEEQRILRELQSEDPDTLLNALETVSRKACGYDNIQFAMHELESLLKTSKNANVLWTILKTLEYATRNEEARQSAIKILLTALDHDNAGVRRFAAESWANVGFSNINIEMAVPRLIGLLLDEIEVATEAAGALSMAIQQNIDISKVAEDLAQLLSRTKCHERVLRTVQWMNKKKQDISGAYPGLVEVLATAKYRKDDVVELLKISAKQSNVELDQLREDLERYVKKESVCDRAKAREYAVEIYLEIARYRRSRREEMQGIISSGRPKPLAEKTMLIRVRGVARI